MNSEFINILGDIKTEVEELFGDFEVGFAFDEGDAAKVYLKPYIVLDGEVFEEEGEKFIKIKAMLVADESVDLASEKIMEVLSFITDLVKGRCSSLVSISLSGVERYMFSRFKKRELTVKAACLVSGAKNNAFFNDIKCYIGYIKVTKEIETKHIWQILDSKPIGTVKEKERYTGIIKNCSLAPGFLKDVFDIYINGVTYKDCTLIYVKGDKFIHEAKFYVGSIE